MTSTLLKAHASYLAQRTESPEATILRNYTALKKGLFVMSQEQTQVHLSATFYLP